MLNKKISEKEINDRKLLNIEIIITILTIVMYFIVLIILIVSNLNDSVVLPIVFVLTAFLISIGLVLVRIEQTAGYYECSKCNNKYVPTYFKTLLSPHIFMTRYMVCPKCNNKSWHKKVLK